MSEESFFKWLSNALQDMPVDFKEVSVGDEKDGQVYVLFEIFEEADDE